MGKQSSLGFFFKMYYVQGFNRKSLITEAVLLLDESQWINQWQPGHNIMVMAENE